MIEKADIIISTRNRCYDLIFTIEHMCKLGFGQDQIYIIDDASTDDTREIILKKFPAINLKCNEISRGYIHNRNTLMSWTKKDFILSLDDDSHIRTREDIEDAIAILNSDNSYGIFGFHAYEQLEDPAARENLAPNLRKVRSYIGCGHIIKRELIKNLGLYREEFEFYCEELDYSIRAFEKGYYVITRDDLVVHHRVDWKLRQTQKNDQQSKGIYGAVWRSKLGFSNHMAIRMLYYPYGLDMMHLLIYMVNRFYHFVLKKKDYQGYFQGLERLLKLSKFIRANRSKLSYALFKEWIKMPSI